MAITVKLQEKEEVKEKPFPKIMKSTITGAIFYFIDKHHGVLIAEKGGDTYKVTTRTHWGDMSIFTDYNSPVTLQNS